MIQLVIIWRCTLSRIAYLVIYNLYSMCVCVVVVVLVVVVVVVVVAVVLFGEILCINTFVIDNSLEFKAQ